MSKRNSKKKTNEPKTSDSTYKALVREKRTVGRPKSKVARKNVYVELSPEQKALLKTLSAEISPNLIRADIPDLAVAILSSKFDALRKATTGRTREIPQGITDLGSLYLLWDLPLPDDSQLKWTTVRLSPQQAVEFGRIHGTLRALYGSTKSQVFDLALSLLTRFAKENKLTDIEAESVDTVRAKIKNN